MMGFPGKTKPKSSTSLFNTEILKKRFRELLRRPIQGLAKVLCFIVPLVLGFICCLLCVFNHMSYAFILFSLVMLFFPMVLAFIARSKKPFTVGAVIIVFIVTLLFVSFCGLFSDNGSNKSHDQQFEEKYGMTAKEYRTWKEGVDQAQGR